MGLRIWGGLLFANDWKKEKGDGGLYKQAKGSGGKPQEGQFVNLAKGDVPPCWSWSGLQGQASLQRRDRHKNQLATLSPQGQQRTCCS